MTDVSALLARHAPRLAYDSQEAYFADSAAIWTDSPYTQLRRADGTVLAAAPEHLSGLASGINNAVSRTAGLIVIAALPLVVGLSGDDYRIGSLVAQGFRHAMWACVGLLAVGVVLTAVGLKRTGRQ